MKRVNSIGLVVLSLSAVVSAVGCQKARMKSVPPKQTNANAYYYQSPPPTYSNPPPTYNNPPPTNPTTPVQPVYPTQPVQPVEPSNPVVPPSNPGTVVNPAPPQTGTQPTFQQPPSVTQAVVATPPPPRPDPQLQVTQKYVPEPVVVEKSCGETGTCPELKPIAGECEVPLRGQKHKEVKKLDILLVLDTSLSMRQGQKKGSQGEIVQLAEEMPNFLNVLKDNVDYRIGVILGHGPESSKYHGKLFSAGKGDPEVLDFTSIFKQEKGKGGNDEQIRERVAQRVAAALKHKLRNVPNDSSDAQGEALMYSLYTAATSNRQDLESKGLFRKEANLSILIMSDEQDVCFDYTTTDMKPRMKNYTVKGRKVQAPDKFETRFFEQKCKVAANGQLLKPEHVREALMKIKNDQGHMLNTAAVVYKNNDVPAGVEDENEMGHGFLQFVSLTNGYTADLAKVNRSNGNISFANELKFWGEVTAFRMSFTNVFRCQPKGIHPAAIDLNTVKVTVLNDKRQMVGLFAPGCNKEECTGHVTAVLESKGGQTTALETSVDAKALNAVLTQFGVEQGSAFMEFMTRPDVDPANGKSVR